MTLARIRTKPRGFSTRTGGNRNEQVNGIVVCRGRLVSPAMLGCIESPSNSSECDTGQKTTILRNLLKESPAKLVCQLGA